MRVDGIYRVIVLEDESYVASPAKLIVATVQYHGNGSIDFQAPLASVVMSQLFVIYVPPERYVTVSLTGMLGNSAFVSVRLRTPRKYLFAIQFIEIAVGIFATTSYCIEAEQPVRSSSSTKYAATSYVPPVDWAVVVTENSPLTFVVRLVLSPQPVVKRA